jgi:hypothetical protein
MALRPALSSAGKAFETGTLFVAFAGSASPAALTFGPFRST